MSAGGLDDVAEELYALPLGDFTRARNARAAAAVDRSLADGIRALRKPSLAAWTVDLLVRRSHDDVAAAVALGEQLRDAQDELDAAALAALTRQRRALAAGLARQAAELAAAEGVAVSTAAGDEVAKTLNAAMMDAGAGAAVLTGRLVRALEAVGFDAVDLDGAVGGSLDAAPAPAAPPRDDLARRRERREADRAAREAGQAAAEADRALARATTALDRARERTALLRERADALRADLERAKAQLAEAEAAEGDAQASRARVAADAAGAARRAAAADEAAQRLRDQPG